MPATPTLSASDAQRLQTCLDGIVDGGSASRWASLDQLRYFCDGADAAGRVSVHVQNHPETLAKTGDHRSREVIGFFGSHTRGLAGRPHPP